MSTVKGLRQFLDDEQQQAWLDGAPLPDEAERPESLEQRFKFAGRFEKLLRKPQAEDVLSILRTFASEFIPIPRTTERFYWSVSCLPSTDRTLARVNASWMELFALQPCPASPLVGEVGGGRPASAGQGNLASPPPNPPHKGEGLGLQARFILHLSDFTHDGSIDPDQLDENLIRQCAGNKDVEHFFWKADTFGVRVRGPDAIRAFMAHPHSARAIRRFNLTHLNRGRNAYQASHCYSLADVMLGD